MGKQPPPPAASLIRGVSRDVDSRFLVAIRSIPGDDRRYCRSAALSCARRSDLRGHAASALFALEQSFLYGSAGRKASDVKIALVMHGEATKSVLADSSYKVRFGAEKNPNLAVIGELRKAGVEVFVCGQALASKGFEASEVAEGIKVASAALTVVINRQADGFLTCPNRRPDGRRRVVAGIGATTTSDWLHEASMVASQSRFAFTSRLSWQSQCSLEALVHALHRCGRK